MTIIRLQHTVLQQERVLHRERFINDEKVLSLIIKSQCFFETIVERDRRRKKHRETDFDFKELFTASL